MIVFFQKLQLLYVYILYPDYFLPGAGNVSFSLRNTTYENNSLVNLEDIGEDDDALLCTTDLTACCRPPYTGEMGSDLGNWFFPNETRVPNEDVNNTSGLQWDFYRTSSHSMVLMHRKRGGVTGNYRCRPDVSLTSSFGTLVSFGKNQFPKSSPISPVYGG